MRIEIKTYLLQCGENMIINCSPYTHMDIICEGCEYYDRSDASICDPAMNGRFRKSETVVYESLKLPEHDEDEDSENEDSDLADIGPEYSSINEWICSGKYVMDAEFKAVYSAMLSAAATMERLDRYRSCGDLANSKKVFFRWQDYDMVQHKDDGFFDIFQ